MGTLNIAKAYRLRARLLRKQAAAMNEMPVRAMLLKQAANWRVLGSLHSRRSLIR